MKRYFAQLALMFILLSLLLPLAVVHADMGPKPSMQFTFKFQGQPIAIAGGQQLECNDPACADGKPLAEGGPQRFTCNTTSCYSRAYGYAPYHKLVIQFADRTRESNVFQMRAFDAAYRVIVSDTALQVDEVPQGIEPLVGGPFQGYGFLFALIVTIVIETIVAAVYVLLTRLPRSVLALVPFASIISLPLVWFVFPRLPLSVPLSIILAEVFAILFEAAFIYYPHRQTISFRRMFYLSLLMNAFSFVGGYFFS